jgi:uncharacterized membrane protein AbrB (regulator of aidB expression)
VLSGKVPAPRALRRSRRSTVHWLQLIILSVALAALFERLGLPASRLLGPMVAAIALTADLLR